MVEVAGVAVKEGVGEVAVKEGMEEVAVKAEGVVAILWTSSCHNSQHLGIP